MTDNRLTRKAWPPGDDEQLRAMVVTCTYAEIAKAMGRTVGSIEHRAHKLGIGRCPERGRRKPKPVVEMPRPGVIVHRII